MHYMMLACKYLSCILYSTILKSLILNMGCCESRGQSKEQYDLYESTKYLEPLRSPMSKAANTSFETDRSNDISSRSQTQKMSKLSSLISPKHLPIDPKLIPDYSGLENLRNFEETHEDILTEKLRQANAILLASREFHTDYLNEGLVVKFQEFTEGNEQYYAGFTEINFQTRVPSQKLVHFLNHKSKRIQWDYDVKALETSGNYMNDYIQYTRIENPKIFRKFYVERRLTQKYHNQVLILSFSIDFDADSVPKHINRMATLGQNLLSAYFIKQYLTNTILTIVNLYEHTELSSLEEKYKIREGQNWVSAFKRLLFESEADIYEPRPTV